MRIMLNVMRLPRLTAARALWRCFCATYIGRVLLHIGVLRFMIEPRDGTCCRMASRIAVEAHHATEH